MYRFFRPFISHYSVPTTPLSPNPSPPIHLTPDLDERGECRQATEKQGKGPGNVGYERSEEESRFPHIRSSFACQLASSPIRSIQSNDQSAPNFPIPIPHNLEPQKEQDYCTIEVPLWYIHSLANTETKPSSISIIQSHSQTSSLKSPLFSQPDPNQPRTAPRAQAKPQHNHTQSPGPFSPKIPDK